MIAIVVLLLLYFYLQQNPGALSSITAGGAVNVSASGVSAYAFLGPNSDPSRWYQGIKPGTVTIGGQPAGADWQPSHEAQTGLALAGQGLGAVGALNSTGVIAITGGLGTALGVATLGIGLVGTVVGMIWAHHQQALAAEGKALNDADPRMMQAFALVLQAVLAGEIADVATAQSHVDTIISDWYGEVHSVERGTWHYTGEDLSADYNKVWINRFQPKPGAPGFSDYHAPNPCNGSCVVGHLFTERDGFLVMAAVADALKGNHGVLILPAIPPHETQRGTPAVQVVY